MLNWQIANRQEKLCKLDTLRINGTVLSPFSSLPAVARLKSPIGHQAMPQRRATPKCGVTPAVKNTMPTSNPTKLNPLLSL